MKMELRNTYIIGGIDGANHACLAMVVLVLCTVEGDRIGILDGHCKGWLTGCLTRLAEQESRVKRAIWLTGSAATSSSRSDGMILRILAKMYQIRRDLTYSSNPNELDCVTNIGGDGGRTKDPKSTCANLNLVSCSIGGRDVSRSNNDRLGEMHGSIVVYIVISTGE
jgi:hypothetical protein